MPHAWLRPTTVTDNGSLGAGLPSVRGGPFPDGVEALCTSPFGPRAPILLPDGTSTGGFHSGADFWRPEWKTAPCDLLALSDGVVEFAQALNPSQGNWIGVRTLSEPLYPNGRYRWDYFHMRDAPALAPGDSVTMGQVVGVVGTTGFSTGVHVHVQIIDNTAPIDPILVFEEAPDVGESGPSSIGGGTVEIAKKVNYEAIELLYDLLHKGGTAVAQQDGAFIGIVHTGTDTPAGYKDVIVRVKEG